MGVTYKPEDARRRRTKDKALKDLDPNLREPIKSHSEDLERNPTKRSKKTRDLIEKK